MVRAQILVGVGSATTGPSAVVKHICRRSECQNMFRDAKPLHSTQLAQRTADLEQSESVRPTKCAEPVQNPLGGLVTLVTFRQPKTTKPTRQQRRGHRDAHS